MRIADRTTARNYLKYLGEAKQKFADTNERVALGNRFTDLSDDVSAGTRVLRVRSDLYKAQKHYDNVKSISDELSTTESAMMSINDILNDVHGTKLVKAMTEGTGEAGRIAIANEVKAMKDEILQFANTRYSKSYVFGGSNASTTAPFTVSRDGKMLFNGVDMDVIQSRPDGTCYYMDGGVEKDIPMNREVYMDIGLGIRMNGDQVDADTAFKISYSGVEIMGFGKNEAGISNNIYNLLTDIEGSLRNYNRDALGKYDTQLVSLTDKFRANVTNIGAKTSFLESMETKLKNNVDGYKTRIHSLMGVDDAEEATNQAMNDYVLKAVIQMGAKLLPVSLMDFLN